MAEKDEDGNVNAAGKVNADGEMDELWGEIANVLRSQALTPGHEVESNVLGEKKETTDTSDSCSVGVDGSIQNISSDHQESKSNEQGTSSTNQLLAVSSATTSNVPATSQPSSSDITNVESNVDEKKETTGTSASCSLGVIQNISSDHHQVVVGSETSNEQGTSSTNQLLAVSSTTTSNVPVTSVEATSQPSSSGITSVETKSVPGEDEMIYPSGAPRMADALDMRYDLIIKETKAPVKNHRPLPDDEDVTNSFDYTSSDYDETRDRLKKRFPIENDDSKELSNIDLEAEHAQYVTQEPVNQPMSTTQSITTTTASSPGRSPSVPMTKASITSTDVVPKRNQHAMNQPQTQRIPRAMNPRYSQYQFPSGQYGYPGYITRPPYLPPPALPFQQHGGGNMARYGTSSYWRPEQNYIYNHNMPPQFDASTVPYGTTVPSLYWRPEQNCIYNYNMPPQFDASMVPYGTTVPSPYWRPGQNYIYNYNMPPQFDASMVPYGTTVPSPYWRPEQNNMPQLGAPIVPYPYGCANRFGAWRGNNPPNLRFGYEAGVSSNYLHSMMQYHQGRDLNAWRPNQEHQQLWYDVSASVGQQNDRSDDDPSDQTQQLSPPRDN